MKDRVCMAGKVKGREIKWVRRRQVKEGGNEKAE